MVCCWPRFTDSVNDRLSGELVSVEHQHTKDSKLFLLNEKKQYIKLALFMHLILFKEKRHLTNRIKPMNVDRFHIPDTRTKINAVLKPAQTVLLVTVNCITCQSPNPFFSIHV